MTWQDVIVAYLIITMMVGVPIAFVGLGDDDIVDCEFVLSSVVEFFKCVFLWECMALESTYGIINIGGIIILEILIFLCTWYLSIVMFCILIFCLILKLLWKLFMLIFGKRDDKE
jgi:hypothetical protein